MDRVASTTRFIDDIEANRRSADRALEVVGAIAQAPPFPAWTFVLAAAAGAVALAVIFGVEHPAAAAIIFVSAGAGAFLRRGLAQFSTNVFIQPFCAALVAGVIGAAAVRFQLSSSLRLVAVCPCMVLVPGPHFLNGALDLIEGRIHLGTSGLIYGLLIVVAISLGLLLGLTLLGVSLPVDPPAGRSLWQDVIAAGVASPPTVSSFPRPDHAGMAVAVGMAAHALRWVAIVTLGASLSVGAFGLPCSRIGACTRLAPFAYAFAAIGFASVVSMIPVSTFPNGERRRRLSVVRKRGRS
jgi:uncharacterized membrane protein YjjB (DUF3815 family)